MKRSAPVEGSCWDRESGVAGRSPQRREEPRCCWVPVLSELFHFTHPVPQGQASFSFIFSHVSPLLWAWTLEPTLDHTHLLLPPGSSLETRSAPLPLGCCASYGRLYLCAGAADQDYTSFAVMGLVSLMGLSKLPKLPLRSLIKL